MSSYTDRIEALKRQREKNASADSSKTIPQNNAAEQTTTENSGNSKYSSRVAALLQQRKETQDSIANRTIAEPESFHSFGGKYIRNADGGYSKVTSDWRVSERDRASRLETGHDTLGADLSQAIRGGLESWKANQFSTLATIDNVAGAIREKDNYYQPEVGSAVWKQNQASSARTRAANNLLEGSKEGRGKVGQVVMDVTSQGVMNGIDAAIKSIPIVGQALGTASFMSRSFGGKAQEMRDQGKSVGTQVVAGVVSAAIEQATESMWGYGGVRDYSGKYLPDSGLLGRLTSKTEAAIAEKLSPVVAKLVMSFGTEAVEEMAADLINPLVTGAVESWFGDTKLLQDFEKEELQSITDILYDGLIGGLSGIGGGMVESVGLSSEIKNEYGGDKSAYVTAIRNQQQQQNETRDMARSIHRASLSDTLDKLLNKRTGKTASELASEVAGTYVSQKNAYKMLGKQSEDYVKICRDTAKRFADTSFANEVMNKKFLENAAFRYLVNGDFASELNSVDDARQQIQTLAKYVMEEFANDKIANAKGKKGKAQAAFYNSVLAKLFDNGTATTTASLDDVDNITEARTYQYSEEDLADNVDNAEQEEEIARPAPQKPRTESKSQQEVNAMTPQERAKWMLDSGSDTIRLEGSQNSKTYSAEAKALFDTISEEAKNRGLKAEIVYNNESKQWEAKLTQDESAQDTKQQAPENNAGKAKTPQARNTVSRDLFNQKLKEISEEESKWQRDVADEEQLAQKYDNASYDELSDEDKKWKALRGMEAIEKRPGEIAKNNLALRNSLRYIFSERAQNGLESAIKSNSNIVEISNHDSTQNDIDYRTALEFQLLEEESEKRGYSVEPFWDDKTNSWKAELSKRAEEQAKESKLALTTNDKRKINRLFQGKQNSVKIASDAHGNLLLDTMRQRAEASGVEVIVENGKARLAVKGENNVGQEEQAIQNSPAGYGENAENAPTYAKSLTEIRGENRPTSRLVEDSNAFGWDRNLWDYLRRGLERLRVLAQNGTAADTTFEQLKNGSLDTGKYIYSLTDENGNATGEIISADAEEMDEQTASAFVTALKLCEGYDDVDIKVIRGYIRATPRTGGDVKNVYGLAYRRADGSYGYFASSEMKTVQVHEPAHVLYKRLNATNNSSAADNALDSALTVERKAEIISKYFPDLSAFDAKDELFARLANRMQWFTNEEVESFYNSLLDSGNKDAVDFAKRSLQFIQPLLKQNKLNIDDSRYSTAKNETSEFETASDAETAVESEPEIQNKKGTFRDDVAYAVTSEGESSVSEDDVESNINLRANSSFKIGDENGYRVYVAYSKGKRNRFDDVDKATIQGQDNTEQSYTAEVYDGNKLVCRTSLSAKNVGAGPASHQATRAYLAERIAKAIGAYERGELKAVVPAPNGIGTKAQFKKTLDSLMGIQKAGDINTFKNGDQTSETFTVGNYTIEMSSDMAEDAQAPSRWDKYHYSIKTNDGVEISRGTWPMGSDYSPSWIIAEDIHQYAIEQGERAGVNDRVAKNGEIKERTFNSVKSTGNTATAATAQAQSETSKQVQQREEQNEAYAEAERQAMSDEELFERRYEDKYKTPTVQDTEREMREQPKATDKMSAKEANEIANLSFGEKGRVRATRAVERFNRIKSIFEADENGKLSGIGERVQKAMDTMRQHLVNVNDGYGTVQQIADEFRSWRDNKAMKDYWNEDVQARFDKILEDAESRGWEFNPQEQHEFAQAYEEACNAMTARINNVNKDTDRMSKLKADAIANKRGWKSDGLLAKAAQKWIRMQATTDTALKFFGGFKGSGAFYDLSKDIKDSVAKRMVTYVDAYSYFDALKKMDGFKEFSENKKLYKLNASVDYLDDQNPLAGHEFTLQQIVTIKRLFETLNKTFEHSKPGVYDRIKGFVVRDAKGKSVTIELKGKGDSETHNAMVNTQGLVDAERACNDILKQEGAVFEVARAYDKACNEMFKKLGKQVSDVRKALTGNALSLIGENYTPVLWANEDGTPADFNFNDDDRIKPPSFLYNRTAKQGYLVVSDISYIVDKYIEKAADYVGTAKIKDTLARMNDGTSLLDNGKGLNSALAENFGKEAGSWFDEYVKDLTEYGENDSIWAALRRNMQKGALIGSPSVMMKQTSSYWSAMGLLSPEALTMAYRWKVGVKAADNSEFNPLLKYRSISDKFDPTLSEIIQDVSRYGKASSSRVFQLFVNGISAQDYKTVDNLYTATMIDTYLRNQNKDAKYFTSGEFQSDIDSKFTEVMMRSQPMFDTELRAEYARTDNELVKMTSMFRTQQTQNLNLIATAIGEYNASKGTGNQAEKAEVLRQTVAGQASAALSLALLSVAADFILHGLKKYRGDGDDEDEKPGDGKIELGRILGRIGLNAVEAGAGTAWFGDSVAKWLIDQMSGGETNEFYSFNMGPLSTMKSVIDNLEYAAKSPTPSNIKNVATNVAQLLGIPLNNAYRYVNSAVMYAHTLTGNNDKKYDDMLKMWGGAAKVADKNIKGRNLLVDSGMSKREANAFVRLVDEDGNGLNKEDLTNWYVDHPEDGDKVSILWDSMGWKQTFAKAKKSLDKKVVYNSNPIYSEMDEDDSESVTKAELMNYYIDHPDIRDDLEKMYTDLGFKDFKSAVKSADKKIKFRSNPLYAEMDEDENESVSKTELAEYAIAHPEMYDTLAPLYKELGFSGTFRSAIRSAESTKIKEAAEDAFYDGDYNALFESVSQMKNGKTWLTNMVKDEYPEYENMENPLLHYLTESGLGAKQVDSAVESFGGKKLVPQYKKLRESGLSPKQSVERLDLFDANDNGSITQTELADYYKAHPEEEAIIAEFWSACGWSKTWKQYKKSKKLK